ncbi:hypothetical protein FF38_09726, partial [Lucilia cuprina]
MSATDYFSVQVFFLLFREALESAIIVSVLLSFLKRSFDQLGETNPETDKLYRKLRFQVWFGALAGISICGIIGLIFILTFQFLGKNIWNKTEKLWEAFFCIIASLMITVMGRSMLRVNKMQKKWQVKLAKAILREEEQPAYSVRSFARKYTMAILPMVTTMREGLEAVAFLGGLGMNVSSSSIPLSTITALGLGLCVGLAIYKYGCNHGSIRNFVLASSCFLYLVAAGLLSRGVWFLEMHRFIQKVGQDVSESGSGPVSLLLLLVSSGDSTREMEDIWLGVSLILEKSSSFLSVPFNSWISLKFSLVIASKFSILGDP